MAVDPNWFQRWQLNGNNPTVVMDPANGLAWDGTQTLSSQSTLVNNGIVTPGSGIILNANNITLTGAALNACQGTSYALQVVTTGGTNAAQFAAAVATSPDGSTLLDQILVKNTGNGIYSFKTSASDTITTSGTFDFTKTLYWGFANSIPSGYRTVSGFQALNASVGNDTTSLVANPNSVFLGSLTPQFSDQFGGFLQQLAIYNNYAPPPAYQFLPPAFVAPNAWWYNFGAGNGISFGNILQLEYTQTTTVVVGMCLITSTGAGNLITGIIYSNVGTTPPYPGHEMWVDGSGKLRARLIFNNNTALVDVQGSTFLADGQLHYVARTQDGSGRAAGIQFYVDGIAETMTTISDNLSNQSIIGIGNNWFFVGNQSNGSGSLGTISPSFAFPGAIGMFDFSNTVRPLSYIQSFKINQPVPPVDGNTLMRLTFAEGSPNITTTDKSSNGFTGTLTASNNWLRGISAPLINFATTGPRVVIPPAMVFM